VNLLAETLDAIAESGHSHTDVVFIGSQLSGHSCAWDEYAALADFEYDNGYGGQIIASDLAIVFFDGGQLRRAEYDGSEWWEFIAPFRAPEQTRRISTLKGETLAERNQ
jgi:hypothetical protein